MKYRLQDLIDMEHFQNLQDRLNEIYSFPSSIIDNDGNILTATAWQDICTQFHRKNKDTELLCIKSDQYIQSHIHEANPAVSYRCPHGLVDNATPIIIDGIHYGNFFTGQFFLEEPDLNFFKSQAKKYGFDEEAYLEAVKKVPIWTQEQLNNYLFFIKGLIAVISESGLKKLKEMEIRKQIEKNEKRHRSILKTAMDGYWLTDTEGRLIEVNDAYCRMSGYSEDELLNMRIPDLEAVEDPQLVAAHMKKVITQGSDRFESKHRRKDGSVFEVEVSIQFRPGDGGQCVCFLRDITERKQTGKILRVSEKKYRTLFENMAQGVFYQKADGVLTDYNNASLEMFGLTPDQFIGKTSLDPQWKVINEDGTDLPADEHPSMVALQTGKPVRDAIVGVYNLRRKNYKWLIVNAIPQFDEAGDKPYQVFVTLQDITDLRQAEWQYQMLFKEMLDGFALHEIICDAAGQPLDYRFLAVNPAFEKITGLKAIQIMNRTVLDVLPGIEQHWIETYGKVALSGEPAFFENYAADIGKHFQVTAFRPAPNQFACIFSDITERKKAEEALKESKLFLDNMSDIAYRADDKGNLVWVNSVAERITGFSRDDLIGKPFLPLFIEADHPSLIDVYKRTLMGESLENTLTFISGVSCHFTSLPYRNANGDIVGTFGVARDITAQLDAQRALQASEKRLKKAQEMAKIGNWEYDISTGKVWGSEEAFRIYGFERLSEFLPLDEVQSCNIDAKRVNQALVDLIAKNQVYDIEFQINSKIREGLTLIHSMADLVCDSEGNPVKVDGVIQDITEYRRMEEERQKLQAQLDQAQKMESVGRLAGGVAHDFNNMLAIILGYAEMALDQVETTEPLHAHLEEIRRAANRSADLTRQLLAFARKQTISPKVLDLNKTLEGMLKMLRRLIGENIDLAWLPSKNLWPVKLDPSQIDQILANLCVNARDSIVDAGKVTIETGTVSFDETYCADHFGFVPGDYDMLAVSDNGCGMNKEILENIFEPFFTTKDVGQGSGLGLATVYGIVKQNSGFINVYSEPDQGTTFKIYLPRHMETDELEQKSVSVGVAATGNETILLVEDEKAILTMTSMMLERLGYTVLTASTPKHAVSISESYPNRIDLLMTDVVMPEMSGRNLAEKLLQLNPSLKCLFMSGYTANVIAHQGVLDKGVHFIHKPFKKQDLATKLREVLEDTKTTAP